MKTSTNFPTMKFIVSFTFVILFSSLFVGDAYGSISITKGPFTWTDKIHIKISEYGVDRASVKISTSTNQLLDYKLSKVRDNLYTGEVILTGFLHDVDGDGKPDTNPRTMGSGSNNGFLEITRDDEFKISVRFADGDKISQSVKIRWNEGTIAFDMPSYTPNESAKLQVTDADMNLNPEALDTIQLFVFSDSDKAGIKVKAIETQEESGLFETTVSFTQDRTSSGDRLFAISGDMIYAQYNDYTLPKPYRINDDLEIIAESTINIIPIQKTILDADSMNEEHESSVKIESHANEKQFISPLKQFKSGIPIDEIQCRELMTLMVKHDGSPSCVKKKNFEKLIQRNWGQAIPYNKLVMTDTPFETYLSGQTISFKVTETGWGNTCNSMLLSITNLDTNEIVWSRSEVHPCPPTFKGDFFTHVSYVPDSRVSELSFEETGNYQLKIESRHKILEHDFSVKLRE